MYRTLIGRPASTRWDKASVFASARRYANRAQWKAAESGAYHDRLYQNWKIMARISQAMSTIEAELKTLYALAAAEHASKGQVIALPAPGTKAPLEVLSAIDVTDVVAKRMPRKLKATKKSSRASAKKPDKAVNTRAKRFGGEGNTAKVHAQLQKVLNHQTFTALNQSAIAVAIGLPKGSIGASVKKLIQEGKIVQGEGKEFKLVSAA